MINKLNLKPNKLLLIRVVIVAMVFGILIIPGITRGATINALSCSQEDVQAAIDLAQDGDTVKVPAGSCMWAVDVLVDKAITLQGNGVGWTHIINGKSESYNSMLDVTAPARITGFTFKGETGTNNKALTIGVSGAFR